MDAVFRALADPSRRLLLDSLNERDGQSLGQLCAGLSMARQSVTRHLAVLEAAGLVTTERRGREKLHHLDTGPISTVSTRWFDRYRRAGAEAIVEFGYATYIRTTPERLWHAITNPEASDRCLGHAIESDWLKGSTYVWVEAGRRLIDPDQLILESDPYRRLAFTFHTGAAEAAAEPRSRVVIEIEPSAEQVELTLTHTGFRTDSAVYQLISQRWPRKLANLKSELERAVPPR